MADGQDHGGDMALVDDPAVRLAAMRGLTARAIHGEVTGDPAFDALGVVARECGLTQGMADAVIEGFALDTAGLAPTQRGRPLPLLLSCRRRGRGDDGGGDGCRTR